MTTMRSTAWRDEGSEKHPLHAPDRAWPETNCYLDLWIELLHALGRDPLPLVGVAIGLSWEADHFTFLKPSATHILAGTGVTLHEMALWDDIETHVIAQIAAESIPLIEVDAFHLPDTLGNAYREVHTKTTIAITAIDPIREWIGYIHNSGHYSLSQEDYRSVFGRALGGSALFPYAELARVSSDAPTAVIKADLARRWAVNHARSRALGNPIAQFAAALPDLLRRVGQDPARINALCFNTTRQLGSTFGLLADHLVALGAEGAEAAWLAAHAKALQFRIARVARRGRTDPGIAAAMDDMATAWEGCMAAVDQIATHRTSSGRWETKTAA